MTTYESFKTSEPRNVWTEMWLCNAVLACYMLACQCMVSHMYTWHAMTSHQPNGTWACAKPPTWPVERPFDPPIIRATKRTTTMLGHGANGHGGDLPTCHKASEWKQCSGSCARSHGVTAGYVITAICHVYSYLQHSSATGLTIHCVLSTCLHYGHMNTLLLKTVNWCYQLE